MKEIAKFELYGFSGAAVPEILPNAKPQNVVQNPVEAASLLLRIINY